MMVSRKTVAILVGLAALMACASSLYRIWYATPEPVWEPRLLASAGNDMPIFYVRTDQRQVALTFDISWGEKTWPLVLPVLQEHGVRSTFFLSGPWSERHSEAVRSIVEDGHEIASHGHKHENLSPFDGEHIDDNIRTAHEILKRISGQTPRFFRPPNGDYDDLVVGTARELGYETVIWSVDSLDWKNPGVDFMVERVLKQVFPGAILLFHASDSCEQTHLALPEVITGLEEAGYQLVTLGELVDDGEPAREDPRGRPHPPTER